MLTVPEEKHLEVAYVARGPPSGFFLTDEGSWVLGLVPGLTAGLSSLCL